MPVAQFEHAATEHDSAPYEPLSSPALQQRFCAAHEPPQPTYESK